MSASPDDLIPGMGDAPTPENKEGLWESVRTVVYAVLIAMLVRTFAFEPFSIPSGSMIPTLLVGDYLFVSKLSYGYSRHSFPFSLPLVPGENRLMFTPPERGDVAVFKLPTDGKTDYIKRIIGLPGDRIQVREGVLHINGDPVFREPAGTYNYRDGYGRQVSANRYIEILPGGRRHVIIEVSDHDDGDNTTVYEVPKGHYFAMGDNRDNSRDSRYIDSVGFIPAENLVGRADLLLFSYTGSLWKVWEWPDMFRNERFFKDIE